MNLSLVVASNVTSVDEGRQANFYTVLTFGGIGALLNFFVFIIMVLTKIAMNDTALVLIRFQLILDGWACVFLIVEQFKVPLDPNNDFLYRVVCAGFERSMFVWMFLTASAYNIVGIAAQRYVITCHPFKQMTKKHSYIAAVLVVLMGIFIGAVNYGLEVEAYPKLNICIYKYTERFANIFWCVLFYLVPCCLIVFFYAKILAVLRKRRDVKSTGSNTAEQKVFRNAVVVACLFMFFAAWNTFTYFLMPFNVISRQAWEDWLRYLTYFSTMLNSASTPLVYIIFLSSIRKKIMQIIFCQAADSDTTSSVASQATTVNGTKPNLSRSGSVTI